MPSYSALKRQAYSAGTMAALALPHFGSAAITVDGSRDLDYGPALAVQTVQTQFGDNFNEWNAGYARVLNGALYLMLTGNLEANFNRLNVFIDSKSGGQSVIASATNPGNDGWASSYNGFTFDDAFTADYLFIMRQGNDGGVDKFDLDYAVVGGGASSADFFGDVFGGSGQGTATTLAGVNLGQSFSIGFNNSNTAGVTGGSGTADPLAAQAVMTGIEMGIPLAALGNPVLGDSIRISVMQNNQGHNYLANQILGGLPAPQGNLGGDGNGGFNGNVSAINLNNFAGDQFFTVFVPEPSTWALAGFGLASLLAFRRRR